MATLRHIRRRIESVKSTQQITKAMKMVAAAKLRKTQNQLEKSRPYAFHMEEIIGHMAAKPRLRTHPFFQIRKEGNVCIVLVTADRGLCGSFNTNLIRRAATAWEQSEAQQKSLITIGRKGYDHFRRRNYSIDTYYRDLFNHLEYNHALAIADELIKSYAQKKFDRIDIIYSTYISAVQQEIITEQLLPIKPVTIEKERFPAGFIFEPNSRKILDTLCPQSIRVQIWRILLESSASEFGARMTAMETATDNAQEMIKELTLYYNKARQAAITKELIDITTSAAAIER